MATTIKITAALVAALAATGCAPVSSNYGEALAFNKAAQIIDPTPVYSADGAQPGDSGEAAVTAAEGYRERPASQVSNRGGGGSSGGGIGGGGSGPR